MKKLIVPAICVLVGCAAGAAMPAITAQTYGAPAPGAQRWENFCRFDVDGRNFHRQRNQDAFNAILAEMGRNGWEYVGSEVGTATGACFRRPAR